MQIPTQITFRKMAPSPAVETRIRNRIAELEHVFGRIIACRIVVEASTQRHQQGNIYHVTIDLTVPGREIVVHRDPPEHQAHEDIMVAVRDAFDAARRQLENHAHIARGDVKNHSTWP